MKIAQIAPLVESVPPKLYGGTERVVSYLTEELVRRGHEVTLFASGDSITSAELVPAIEEALRLGRSPQNGFLPQLTMLEDVMARADEFDVLHFHIDLLHLPVARSHRHRTVTTLHGRVDYPDVVAFYDKFRDAPLVAISNDQRSSLLNQNWAGTVYNGIPKDLLPFDRPEPGGYLAFLGRISPDKGPDLAIEIASRSGLPLKIAAKVEPVDQPYWHEVVEPMIRANLNVEYVGEVNERAKARFLSEALALLFPIQWREPFGLVMIEAMACGTPVIAWRHGAAPEVIEEGISGYIVDSVDAAVQAVQRVHRLDRTIVRRAFERRFTAEHMVDGYLRAYRNVLAQAGREIPVAPASGADDPSLRVVA